MAARPRRPGDRPVAAVAQFLSRRPRRAGGAGARAGLLDFASHRASSPLQSACRPDCVLTYLLLRLVFFASGVAALVYQIVWQRLLTFFSGADVYSVTLIVTAFMAGLGFGSLAGGHLADRLSERRRVLAFALAEAGVALFALWSVPLLHGVLFLRLGPLALPGWAMTALLFLTLLLPTFLMGLSLPLLARVVTPHLALAGRRIGGLYGWNTLGAAVGALGTVWVGVRALGFAGSVHFGAALNFGCALVALAIALRPPRAEPPAAAEDVAPPVAIHLPFATWLGLYALSGFVALSLEIVWFRLLGILLKSNSFTFATLLAIFLGGLGLGALIGSRLAPRSQRPAHVFLMLQAGIPLYAGLSLGFLVWGLAHLAWLRPLAAYLAEYDPIDIAEAVRAALRYLWRLGDIPPYYRGLTAQFAALYVALPVALVGPPTLLMGLSFPFLQRAVQTDLDRIGRRVGWLQGANIVGSTLGSALTGLLLLPLLGTAWTLRALVLAAVVYLSLRVRLAGGPRRLPALAALAAVALTVAATPSAGALWASLHGTTPDRVVFAEDGSGLALLKEEPGADRTVVFANGLGQSQLPYGSYHTVLGALPVLVHPRPESVAVIGLGSGDTLFGIAGRPETSQVRCVEIVAAQVPALRTLFRKWPDPGLHRVLTDGRIRIEFGDGRAFLMRTPQRFDVIEADALRSDSAFAGNLYSTEYFELVRSRLRPGGLGVTWSPTRRVRDTFLQVFPHVLRVGPTLIGSDTAIAFDAAAIRERLQHPFSEAYYRVARVPIRALIDQALAQPTRLWRPGDERTAEFGVNGDLFPRDEYLVGQSLLPGSRRQHALDSLD
ncbi:MAG: fused MFS/spermidine synthase [Vicinamibacteria bacterium]|nr:fused MFS/spermidine synthase [Vicinamibacteria bacterium]